MKKSIQTLVVLSSGLLLFTACGTKKESLEHSHFVKSSSSVSTSQSKKSKSSAIDQSSPSIKEATATNKNLSSLPKNSSSSLSSTTTHLSSQQSMSSSSQNSVVSSTTIQSSVSYLAGFNSDLVEYARVAETIIHYYGEDYQPYSVSVTKNGLNHAVFPFPGSLSQPQETVTLIVSSDGSMAGTIIITYSSNHDGSINFYKDPNHYQDERYLKNPNWVKEESQKLLDTTKTIQIPLTYDEQALRIIQKIQVQ